MNTETSVDFKSDPRLKNMHPLKLKVLMALANENPNRSIESMIPEVMTINNELNKRGLSFSKEESSIIVDILSKNVSESDRAKFNMIKNFL